MFPERQRGFALVSAIFLLVVLAALGGFIATISTTQHIGSALDVSGARAYQAARAGTEWGLSQVVNAPHTCTPSTDIATVGTMAVTVTCTQIAPVFPSTAGSTVETGLGAIFNITATACNMPTGTTCPGTTASPNYVERQITVLVENPCSVTGFPACS